MAAEPVTIDSLRRALANGAVRPVNILHGEEGYYIDQLVKLFERIIPKEDRDYALTNIYAPQIENPQAIIDICRQLPMMTDRQVVIVRELQNVKANFIEKLIPYLKEPTESTVLVLVSRGEKIKSKKAADAPSKDKGVVYESAKVWPSNLPRLITDYVKSIGMNIEPKAVDMLTDFIGANLSQLFNEIDKLAQILGLKAMITPEAVERNVGISKDFNNFELIDAIAARDFGKMTRIVDYFGANPKNNPYPVTAAAVFGYFANLLQAFYTPDRSERGLQAALGIRNSFELKRITSGMKNYNAFQIIEIIDAIRRYDAMSKGSGSRQDPYRMLSDLMYHIISAPGKLPV